VSKLDLLEEYAYDKDIDVLERPSRSKRKGGSMSIEGRSAVFLNKSRIESTGEKTCVLAEEIGHIETGTLLPCEVYQNPEYLRWLKEKNKRRAKKWAIEKILPYEDIQRALYTQHTEVCDLAEELGVPAEYLQAAIEYYAGKGIIFIWGKR